MSSELAAHVANPPAICYMVRFDVQVLYDSFRLWIKEETLFMKDTSFEV